MEQASSAILIVYGDRLALQRRDEHAPTNPGKLSLFGGSCEKDETPFDCAVRELREETSIAVDAKMLRPVADYYRDDVGKAQYIYKYIVDQPEFTVYEGEGSEWYTPEELRSRSDLTSGTRIALTRCDEFIKALTASEPPDANKLG